MLGGAVRDWFFGLSAGRCAVGDTCGLVRMTIKLLDGRSVSISADPALPIGELKRRLAAVCGIQEEHQRLVFGGRALREDLPLEHYQLCSGALVHLVPVLCGGSGPDGVLG